MMIKCQALANHLIKKKSALYILTGQDYYLLNEAAFTIKKSCGSPEEREDKIIDINTPTDWNALLEEANSYSLFSNFTLIDARYEKKSLDNVGKKTIQSYLENINPRCLILIRAPQVPNKQLQSFANHEHVTLVQAYPLSEPMMLNWITEQLKAQNIKYESTIPALIHQYTQNNMLACAQFIEKLGLINFEETVLTAALIKEHLIDQCEYSLYELADACLLAQCEKVIHLLRLASQKPSEAPLVLWILTQEVRQLLQLKHLTQSLPITAACTQLKIWAQRAKFYEKALARFSTIQLHSYLRTAQTLDEQIKSNQNNLVWHGLELLALQLCK